MALLDFSFGVRKNALGAAAVPLKCDPLTLPVKLGGPAEGLWNLSGKIYRDETRTAAAHPFVLSLPSLCQHAGRQLPPTKPQRATANQGQGSEQVDGETSGVPLYCMLCKILVPPRTQVNHTCCCGCGDGGDEPVATPSDALRRSSLPSPRRFLGSSSTLQASTPLAFRPSRLAP